MSYSPPAGNAVNAQWSGDAYTAPAGNAVNADWSAASGGGTVAPTTGHMVLVPRAPRVAWGQVSIPGRGRLSLDGGAPRLIIPLVPASGQARASGGLPSLGVPGACALALVVDVMPPALAAGQASPALGSGAQAAVWTAVVTLDGVDVSARVVGEITVDADEGAARVAEFSLVLAPGTTLDMATWTGLPVTIAIADMSLGMPRYPWPLFAGVVDVPEIDLRARLLRLRCTDDLQGRLDALSPGAIATLIGGRWSAVVFDPAATGWALAQDRLSTVAACLDVSATGALRRTPWAAKPSPDFTFGDDLVEDGSLTVSLSERAGLLNQVDVSFAYRFPRLKSEGHGLSYSYVGPTNFAQYVQDGNWFLQRGAVENAISAAGGTVVGAISWQPLPDEPVALGTLGFWVPGPSDAELCMGFTATVAYDHGQLIEERHAISVSNPQSIAAVGHRKSSLSGALEGQYTEMPAAETHLALFRAGKAVTPPVDVPPVLAGMMTTTEVALTPDTNRAAADEAMAALIDIAKMKIAGSHRRHRVGFTVPLIPALDVDQTVAVSASGVSARGKVAAVVHRLDADAGRAVSEVQLAISAIAGVGVTHPETATAAPAGTLAAATLLPTQPWVEFNHGAEEDHAIIIHFPAVPDADRDNLTLTLTSSYDAAVAEDLFSVTV